MQSRLSIALALSLVAGLVGCKDDPPEVPPCVTDMDCRTGERCVPGGQCVFGAECINLQECLDQDPRTLCNLETFTCDFRDGFGDECDRSRPCAFGQFCSELLGRCLDANTAKDCVRRSQCPANQICDRAANKCIADPGCFSDAFCEDGELCDVVNQVCRSVALECSSCFGTGECATAGDLCFVDTQECLPSGAQPECATGELCDPLGRCVQCTRSEDCGPGLFCNVAVGRCESNVQCADDPTLCPMSAEVTCITCEAPQSCNPRTRRCEAPPDNCQDDIDCPSDQLCDLSQDPPICIPRIPDCLNDLLDTPRNDDVSSASLLLPEEGPRYEELKSCPGDVDWYRLDVTAGTYLTVDARFEHAEGDLDMQLYLADGRTLLDESRTVTDNERLELEVGTDLAVFVRVFFAAPSINPVPYELIVARDPGDLCMDDSNEPDDGRADAKQLLNDRPYEGRLCAGDPDWFVLRNVPAGSRISVQLDFIDNLGDLDLEVYRADQTQALLSSLSTDDDEALAFDAPFGGDFFVRVFGKSADTNVYGVRAAIRENMGPTCLDDQWEPNDTPVSAIATSSAAGPQALTLCQGDEDWFRFRMEPGQAVDIEIGFEPGADLELKVYEGNITDPDVTPIEQSTGVNPREHIAFRTFTGGDFLARVHGHTEQDISPYELRLNVTSRSLCQPDIADASGQGETRATAYRLPLPPMRQDGLTLCAADTQDWFQFFAAAGFMNVIGLNNNPDDGQVDFELLQADGSLLFSTAGLAPEIPRRVQINVPGDTGFALLFLHVFPTLGFDPEYSLTQDLVPIFSCNPDVAEPNNFRSTPSLVASSSVSPVLVEDLTLCAGTRNLDNVGDIDWFELRPPSAGSRIEARVDFTQGDLLMELYSPNGGPRACINQGDDRCYSDGPGLSERITFTATTTEPYYLRVDSVYSSPNVANRPPDSDTPYDLQIIYVEP